MRALRIATALALVAGLWVPAASAGASQSSVDKSDNVRHIRQLAYTGGTELAASGKYVYAGELNGHDNRNQDQDKGGMRIFDVSGKRPRQVGMLRCPGNDNTVRVVRPGLVVMGFHTNACVPHIGNGMMTIDVRNPRRPRILGAVTTNKNHTLTPLPGTPYVYTSGGGLAGGTNAGPAIVDVSNPRNPEVVARPPTLTMDCHDISFSITEERELGFCAGAIGTGEVQIFDVSDPLEPQTIGRIYNPMIQYSHFAIASSDGNLLAIDDEAFALHECHTGQSPTGRVWIYDISIPEVPVLWGTFAPPRGGDGTVGTLPGWIASWCLSHGLDWRPNSHDLAVTWFTGGVSVLDASERGIPDEVAYFQAEDSGTYSTLWHRGRLYTNDVYRGLDTFQIRGLAR